MTNRRLTDEQQKKFEYDLFDGPEGFFGYQAQLQDDGETDRSLRDVANEFATLKGLMGLERRAFEWILDSYISEEYAASLDELSHWWWDDDADLEGDDLYLANDSQSGFTPVIQHYAKPVIDKICLQTKVLDIDWTELPISVRVKNSASGEESVMYASNVLVTVPLGCLKEGIICFSPGLPQKKLDAINKLGMGCLTKCCLLWDEAHELPWPKDKEWIEQIAKEGRQGKWTELYSPMPLNGRPLLYAYSAGQQASSIENLSDSQIKDEVMRKLRTMFGQGLPVPRHVVVTRWKEDEFSKGSYSFYKVGSNPSHRKALARPLNSRLYFAGEATHVNHFGTSQGALLSGVSAAKQIQKNLKRG